MGGYLRTRIPRRYAHWVSTIRVSEGKEKQIGEGRTSVHVHLDDAILYGGLDLLLRGTGTTVENEEPVAICLKNQRLGGITRTRAWGMHHPTSR